MRALLFFQVQGCAAPLGSMVQKYNVGQRSTTHREFRNILLRVLLGERDKMC